MKYIMYALALLMPTMGFAIGIYEDSSMPSELSHKIRRNALDTGLADRYRYDYGVIVRPEEKLYLNFYENKKREADKLFSHKSQKEVYLQQQIDNYILNWRPCGKIDAWDSRPK